MNVMDVLIAAVTLFGLIGALDAVVVCVRNTYGIGKSAVVIGSSTIKWAATPVRMAFAALYIGLSIPMMIINRIIVVGDGSTQVFVNSFDGYLNSVKNYRMIRDENQRRAAEIGYVQEEAKAIRKLAIRNYQYILVLEANISLLKSGTLPMNLFFEMMNAARKKAKIGMPKPDQAEIESMIEAENLNAYNQQYVAPLEITSGIPAVNPVVDHAGKIYQNGGNGQYSKAVKPGKLAVH